MNNSKLQITLYEGHWGTNPTTENVAKALRKCLVGLPGDDVDFTVEVVESPQDVLLLFDVDLYSTDWDAEHAGDKIVEALLRFKPEFESMIEFEILHTA